MNKSTIFIVLLVILLIIGGGWFVYSLKQSSTNAPSKNLNVTSLKELSRDHITDISGVVYNSNPPTSGQHFAIWAKRGAYPYMISDGHLIHSLEHGYVEISYNCGDKASSSATFSYAKGAPLTTIEPPKENTMTFFTPTNNLPEKVEELPLAFESTSCKQLVSSLTGLLSNYDRLIVVPRTNMDVLLAVSAWGKQIKMNSLDIERIKGFIDAYQYQGPEKTIE
jgi:hypothetical protein